METDIFKPVMRTDENHRERHELFLQLIKTKKIGLLFLGDSLTRRWEENPGLWEKYFSKYCPANFSIGGDTIQNLMWRILNGEIENISPKMIVLLIGTNNLPEYHETEIIEAITGIVRILREKMNRTKIILLGLLPRNTDETGKDYMKMIRRINSGLKKLRWNKTVLFFDIGKKIFTKNGNPILKFFPDGLHINSEGYEILGKVLAKLIEKNWN